MRSRSTAASPPPSPASSPPAEQLLHPYYSYTGRAEDGDMILNDVGAQYDHLFNDVSRGFPCNGKFSERQRQLYTCATTPPSTCSPPSAPA